MAAHIPNKVATSFADYTMSLIDRLETNVPSSFSGIASLLVAGSIMVLYYSPDTHKVLCTIKARLSTPSISKIDTSSEPKASTETTKTLADLYTELKSLQLELSTTQASLQATRVELSDRQFDILSTQAKLSSAEIELSSTQQELLSSRSRTRALESELHTARATIADLEATRTQLGTARTQISALEAELDAERKARDEAEMFQEKELDAAYSCGYDDGFEDGYAPSSPPPLSPDPVSPTCPHECTNCKHGREEKEFRDRLSNAIPTKLRKQLEGLPGRTCIGKTARGYRCGSDWFSPYDIENAEDGLQKLLTCDPSHMLELERLLELEGLERLVGLMLCKRWHQGQQREIAREWFEGLEPVRNMLRKRKRNLEKEGGERRPRTPVKEDGVDEGYAGSPSPGMRTASRLRVLE